MASSNRPEIAKWLKQIEVVTSEVKRMCAECSPEELGWKESPSSWSVTEVFDHLRITSDGYLPRVRAALRAKSEAGRTDRDVYQRTWFGRWFIGLLEPGNNRKLKAPAKFVSSQAGVGLEAMEQFLVSQDELQKLLRAAEDIELGGRRLASPITPLIRFTLGEVFDLLTTHQQRHLGQAQLTEKSARQRSR